MKFPKKQHRTKEEVLKEKKGRRERIAKKTSAHPLSQNISDAKKYPTTHLVEGTIRVNAKGIGYVSVEGMKEDIEIETGDLNTALDMDRVTILLHAKSASRRQSGEVDKILYRNKMKFSGVLTREGGTYFLLPDDYRMYRSILIPKQDLHGAKDGDKVFVELSKWTDPKKDPLGKIIQVLGKPNEHEAEMQAIVLERGFTSHFDPDVEEAAEKISTEISEGEIGKRRDMRTTLTFTIDPKDAKDFDDALSWKKLANGNYEVGVHIADVSHYVTPHSRIDKEACERATSIYLVDRTIPMLPERLSNGICSLVEKEDRLTFSAIFEIDNNGVVHKEWFGKTIIHSQKRFTYEEAQKVIDEQKGVCVESLLSLNQIAKSLRKKRILDGAIAFEAEEVRFELDKKGKPIRVYKKIIQDTNKLIEEFMLLANKHVAQLIALKDKRAEAVFVYRVHDTPNEDRMNDLREFLRGIGFELKLNEHKQITSQSINKLLSEIRGRQEESMIQMATVRAMAKAVYTTKNIGHFGLGFSYYTHFTSPIRRYPDLMVHRLLESYLQNKPIPKKKLEEEERLARYASQMEVSASDAERASIKYKQCEYFAERINIEIDGVISGVTEWGIYIEDQLTKAEGMVHVRDIPNDFYFFEEKNYRLVGKTHGKSYRLGDKIRTKIIAVDLKRKLITMRLA